MIFPWLCPFTVLPMGIYGLAFNPISSLVSSVAFNSLGFGTGFLPPYGWT